MNYQRVYNQIIERAQSQNREKGGEIYYESHHIIPKCLGGEGEWYQWKWHPNLVLLTAREHFLVHWLLCRQYPDNSKIVFAFWLMCRTKNKHQSNRYTPSSRTFEESKKLAAKQSSIQNTGRVHTEESLRKQSESRAGKNRPNISRSKLGSLNPMYGKTPWNKDIPTTQETRDKIRLKLEGVKKEVVECPHCGKVGGGGAMIQWHFDNCRTKK